LSKIAYANSNRVGRINVLYDVIRDERPMIAALMALCVVLECEDHESGQGKTYVCASELFQPLNEGDEIPEYRLEFVYDQPFELPEREAARTNSGKFGFVAIRKTIIRAPLLSIGARAQSPVMH
jgi:hypothetical protein